MSGNTVSETRPGSATVSAAYDGYGRLLTYARTGDPSQANAYNGLDDRVSATSGSTTHRFVYDSGGRVLGEYGTSAADVIAETIWLQPEAAANDNEPLGGDDGVGGYAPLAVATGSGSSAALAWVHGNHLGVPIAFTDASGTATSPPSYGLPGFPGQMKTFSDLYYNRYRDYDSSTGRYIQADPIGLEGGSNPYLYAGANPLRYRDPFGFFVPPAPAIVAGPEIVGGIAAFCATPPGWVVCGGGALIGGYLAYRHFCKDGKCPPCRPYPAGTIGYIGPHINHGHGPFPAGTPHLNLFEVQQDPSTCKCYWRKPKRNSVVNPPPEPDWVNLNGPRGSFPELTPR